MLIRLFAKFGVYLAVEDFGDTCRRLLVEIAVQKDLSPDSILPLEASTPAGFRIPASVLQPCCIALRDKEGCYFDVLSNVSAIDLGVDKVPRFEVVYHLSSVSYERTLVLAVYAATHPKDDLGVLPSLSSIWAGADWHEREAFELFGIIFEGHKDLRRLLLPADWQGYPLRKDYKTQDTYRGMRVDYEA